MKNTYFLKCCYTIVLCSIWITLLQGCQKYLGAKSSKSLTVPSSLIDLQALLDEYLPVNTGVGAGMLGGDEYYLTESRYNSLYTDIWRNMYVWADTNVFVGNANTWNGSYDNVYKANTIIEVLPKIKQDGLNEIEWDNVKGQALFLRGRCFFEVAMVWAEAYDAKNAKEKLGIPLRLGTDFNVPSVRSNLEDTYNQIISDLRASIDLLPVKPVHVFRASKPAACGELARVYLSMRMYDSAYLYANKALGLFNYLIDYNTLDTNATYPFTRFGPEVIYETDIYGAYAPYNMVDTSIYRKFDDNDLRKALYFEPNGDGSHKFCGNYNKNYDMFGGVATDELYLIRAECLARNGEPQLALNDLNLLLKNRYLVGTYKNKQSSDAETVLNWILDERLKELLFRGLRWIDIKRYNKEGANITLKRIIGGKEYILPPNDLRYAMAIPQYIIEHSNIKQNPR